jgi:predicted Zn-dependent protease
MQRICFVLLAATAALTAQQRPLGQGVNFYSKEKEGALGAKLAEDVLRHATKVENAEVQAHVDGLVSRLARGLPEDTFPLKISIVTQEREPMREPLALPGGYIFVDAALVLGAANEDELAGLLAHAMAHVAARHWTRLAARAQLFEMAAVPLAETDTPMGKAVRDARRRMVDLSSISLKRGFEKEADVIAVQALAKAGYSPQALAVYVDRTQVDPQSSVVFSEWPRKEQRLAALRVAIEALPERVYSPHDDLAAIQEKLRAALK